MVLFHFILVFYGEGKRYGYLPTQQLWYSCLRSRIQKLIVVTPETFCSGKLRFSNFALAGVVETIFIHVHFIHKHRDRQVGTQEGGGQGRQGAGQG